MIELKNVNKIYKSKKGSDTQALNDINLKIGNKGMLFIVGKSGSGKSTLLNLLGGLDSITSGEILINNKNISKFTKEQYDSYRNTYIGFIFQEFNILEQYNVYENIELSVRLQNHKVEKNGIDNLLIKLGLNDLGNRKINELSGGQKQRVAIARSLIKNPKIILADEPTGNLDKSSSEQIFNILKDISKEQLVIVVSHDIESAQKYADRIIKIEDGKIVEDTKSLDKLEIEPFELKKSKLPFTYALKMSLTNFKTKPFKLFMTILLTSISLIFMGFAVNCALFNNTMLIVNTMENNNNYNYTINNSEFGNMGSVSPLELTKVDIENIKKLTNNEVNPVYSLYDNGEDLKFEFGENDKQNEFYKFEFYNFNYVEVNDSKILGDLIGQEPNKNNEIVVHQYFADYIINFGIRTVDNNLYFPRSYNDIINSKKELKLGENKVIIVGIIKDDDSLYSKAKETGTFESDKLENNFFMNYANRGSYIYTKGFIKDAILRTNKNSFLNKITILFKKDNISNNINALNGKINIISKFGIQDISSLNKKEAILSIEELKNFDNNFNLEFNKYLELHRNDVYEESLKNYVINYLNENYNDLKINLSIYANDKMEEVNDIQIIGISLDNQNYISYDYINEYNPITKKIYSLKVFDSNKKNLYNSLNNIIYKDYFEKSGNELGIYYNYTIDLDNTPNLANIMNTYKALEIYILIISLIFVLFTFLLFSNFIAVSISYCKKEIGILRALGATNKDVIKIFGYESLIIGLLSWIISIIGWVVTCNVLNKSMFGNAYYILNGIVTHPLVPIIMLGYTLIIAIIITIVSISRITSIKPIDAILNK